MEPYKDTPAIRTPLYTPSSPKSSLFYVVCKTRGYLYHNMDTFLHPIGVWIRGVPLYIHSEVVINICLSTFENTNNFFTKGSPTSNINTRLMTL